MLIQGGQILLNAAATGSLNLVEQFLNAGVSPNFVGREGQKTALMLAVERGHEDVSF